MSLAESFEKKFLFGLGRHLWNIVGISGFISVLTGIILLANSTTLQTAKTKENFMNNEKVINKAIKKIENQKEAELVTIEKQIAPLTIQELKTDLSLEGWSKKNKRINPLRNKEFQGRDQISNSLVFDRTLASEEKQILREYLTFEENYDPEKKLMYSKYINTKNKFNNDLKEKRSELDKKYQSYFNKIEKNNAIKVSHGIASPFVMAYGLGVIASASITSAVLAVERNTRK